MNRIIHKASIIGFVRYSQKISFGNKDRNMFESEYFEYRYAIFKNVTLKSFQQQTNQNFVLLLLHSENMPSHYKERFFELENENLFLYNVFIKDTQESFDEAITNSIEYVSFEKDTAVTFRIDNDDAVQNDFIQNLEDFLKKNFVGYAISIPYVTIVKHISELEYLVEKLYYPSNSIGLAYVTDRNNYKTVIEIGQHHLVNEETAIILLPNSATTVLQTINGENAINSINRSKALVYDKEEFNKYLKKRKIENLELNCLRVFSENNRSLVFLFKKYLRLFFPPVYFIVIQKLRNIFIS